MVEISKEEIPGSKRNMHGYILTYARLYTTQPAVDCLIKNGQ